MQQRKSWDTAVKHYVRNNLFENLPESIQVQVSSSNKSRWMNEPESKYTGCEVAEFIQEEIELIKRINQSTRIKAINQTYFNLAETLQNIIGSVKGIKKTIANHKEEIVNTIENAKKYVTIDSALRLFSLSRSTYQHYKTLVINKCDSSYFLWCVKKYPHQLLNKEIFTIKEYMSNSQYSYWSKSSVYLKAVREGKVAFGLSTWYKYCKLLGFSSNRHLQKKKSYTSLTSSLPNQIWCCDVTIFKTTDQAKHYIHLLIDHYSRKILGYSIEKSNSALAIKMLLENAYNKYQPDKLITLLTDGGSENVNDTVANYILKDSVTIKHLVAQTDIKFSNSTIESVNKVLKHQFLLPKEISSLTKLKTALKEDVQIYNSERPQFALSGNTPDEVFEGKALDFSDYTKGFITQKLERIQQNQKNVCKVCR